MANTYTQVVIHAVFTVKYRENLLKEEFRTELFKYISGTLRSFRAYPYAVGGWRDHVHILFELPASIPVSKIIGQTKAMSAKFINDRHWLNTRFSWQEGFSAFSCSKNHRDRAIQYIMRQEEHHSRETFKNEYFRMMREAEIALDERYVFQFFDE